MKPTDLTLRVLTEIRDAIRETNSRVDQANSRLDQTNVRLEAVEHGLGAGNQRLVETEIRLGTAITGVAGTLEELKSLLRGERLDFRDRVERCELDIVVFKERAGIR
ncbi:MAG: hypothetical protein HYY25_16535 [Candidatus Wallbacteria bacterium]|nr:hypothetical protein [Candidatus Wallbacteria bacterium]